MLRVLGTLLVVAMALSGCSSPHGSRDAGPSETTGYFAVTAAGGSVEGGDLILRDPSTSVLAVSDRPLRSVEHLDLATFTEEFAERFGSDPPNAILAAEVDGAQQTLAFVLNESSYDEVARTLRYSVSEFDSQLESVTSFGPVTLILDSAPIDPPAATARIDIDGDVQDLREPIGLVLTVHEASDGSIEVTSSRRASAYLAVVNSTDRRLDVTGTFDDGPIGSHEVDPDSTLYLRP